MAERALKSIPSERDEAPEVRELPGAVPASRPSDVGPVPSRKKLRKLDRRGGVRWGLFAVLPLVLIVGAYWYATGGKVMSTDDAYVDTQKVGISTDVPGIVQAVNVADNERVNAGQVLYRLDPRQYQIALDNAKANLAQTALNIDAMKQDYKRMLSDVAAEQAQVVLDQTNYTRDATLLHSGTVSQAIYDQAQSTPRHRQEQARIFASADASAIGAARRQCRNPRCSAPAISAGPSPGRRGTTPARSHRHRRAFCRPGRRCFSNRSREISRRLDDGFLSRRYRPRLDRSQSERDRAHLCAARPACDRHGRYLSRCYLARHS